MTYTIVIPLFNKAPYIRRTLDSVSRQTFRDFECLVIDDGSTDGGGRLAGTFGDPRVRLLVQANAGAAAARNRGIAKAAGSRIAFLDADDEWKPGFLEAHDRAFRRWPDLAASFTNFHRTGQGPALRPAQGEPRLLKNYFGFCMANGGGGMTSSTLAASASALREAGLFPAGRTRGEDLETWMRLAWQGPVAYVPQDLAVYHEDCGASQSGVPNLDLYAVYAEGLRLGRIPPGLAGEAATFAALCRHRTIHALCRAGRRREAWSLWTQLPGSERAGFFGLAGLAGLAHRPAGRWASASAEIMFRKWGTRRWHEHLSG